jgi:hypothetical protein
MFNKIFYTIFCILILIIFFPKCSTASSLQLHLEMRNANHTEIKEVGIKYNFSPTLSIGVGWSNMGVSNYDYSLIRYNRVSLLTCSIGF